MKTSIRLVLTALAVSGITFAASGKPLPFLGDNETALAANPVLLPPDGVDGPTPGERLVAENPFSVATGSFDRQ